MDFQSKVFVYTKEKQKEQYRSNRKNKREHKRYTHYSGYCNKYLQDIDDYIAQCRKENDHKFRLSDWGISHESKIAHKKYRIKKEKGQRYPRVKDAIL